MTTDRKLHMTKWHADHPVEVAGYKRKWRQANPEKHKLTRNVARKKKHQEFLCTLLAKQQGQCALCPDTKASQVDHDHGCSLHKQRFYCEDCIRGVLCRRCNYAVGYFETRSDLVIPTSKMLNYLAQRPCKMSQGDNR